MQCNCLKYNYLIFRTPLYGKKTNYAFGLLIPQFRNGDGSN
jgi:hypothetical protein